MPCMTYQKSNSMGFAEHYFLGKNIRKLKKNRRKFENLIFCMIFLSQWTLIIVVCIKLFLIWHIYKNSKSIWFMKHYILGQYIRKLKKNHGKWENPLYSFLNRSWTMHYTQGYALYGIWRVRIFVNRGCFKLHFWKTYRNWRKIGKSYFLYQFPSSMTVYQFSVCCIVPCMTYRKYKSIGLWNIIIIGQNLWKLKKNRWNFENFIFVIIFFSQCKSIDAVSMVLHPLCHIKYTSQQRSPNTSFGTKRTKVVENWKLSFFSYNFHFLNN